MQASEDRTSRAKRRAGKAMAQMLVLLVLVIGLGGYNYNRNLQKEETQHGPRAFEAYETEDLTALREAYSDEVSRYENRYQAQDRKRYRVDGSNGLMGENVDQFERVQRNSGRLRELRADVANREARMRDIDEELGIRVALADGFALHLKRLISL
jgi:uncharacterized protein HemX